MTEDEMTALATKWENPPVYVEYDEAQESVAALVAEVRRLRAVLCAANEQGAIREGYADLALHEAAGEIRRLRAGIEAAADTMTSSQPEMAHGELWELLR